MVLLVDDEPVIVESLAGFLGVEGWQVSCATSGEEALARLRNGDIEFVITDIDMPGLDGIELLRRVKEQFPEVEVIIMTGKSTEEYAVQALKLGATDYFHKPIRGPEVTASLLRCKRVQELKSQNTRLRAFTSRLSRPAQAGAFHGQSPATRELLARLQTIARTRETTVLIQGETGVGKEVAACTLHRLSQPEDAPFVAINCAGVSESLLERELFGHEKGAFTGADKRTPGVFEMALGGTVLLDEISEMTLSGQSRLLRVLEERTFRRLGGTAEVSLPGTRIVATTNRDLESLVAEGSFRGDLYFRLRVVPVVIPPLRERREDILPLARLFLERSATGAGKGFSPAAERVLLGHSYPGNVRELRNLVDHAAIFSRGATIGAEEIRFAPLRAPGGEAPAARASGGEPPATPTLRESEIELIRQSLRTHGNNRSAAANALGITPQALYRRISKYHLD